MPLHHNTPHQTVQNKTCRQGSTNTFQRIYSTSPSNVHGASTRAFILVYPQTAAATWRAGRALFGAVAAAEAVLSGKQSPKLPCLRSATEEKQKVWAIKGAFILKNSEQAVTHLMSGIWNMTGVYRSDCSSHCLPNTCTWRVSQLQQ